MKQYIKDNKIYNTPVQIKTEDGKLIYTNNETLILQNGYTIYSSETYKPTLEELIAESDNSINVQTDAKILNDFIFKGEQFYLTMENQTNFANMFIAKDYLNFPQAVKTKTGFYNIRDKYQCEQFYLAGIYFIKKCIEEGWKNKAEAAEKIKTEFQQ